MEKNTEIIACSIFRYELEKYIATHTDEVPINLFNSYLHLFPMELSEKLSEMVDNKLSQNKKVVLICGDCHPFMKEMGCKNNVTKIQGSNCVEILIGRELRRKLQKEGAFFLLPEWTVRWREIFKELLELPTEHIQSLFYEHHKKFVYLDTCVLPVPFREIEECASFFNLPYEIESVPTNLFINTIETIINNLSLNDANK